MSTIVRQVFSLDFLKQTKDQMQQAVKRATADSIVDTLHKMRTFIGLYEGIAKEELIRRAKKSKGVIEADSGPITLSVRNNYTFDEPEIDEYLKKKGLEDSEVYDLTYIVDMESLSPKLRKDLIASGCLTVKRKLTAPNFEAFANRAKLTEKQIHRMVSNAPTEYLKGL
jgi:hypothetical protein